jgi:hypothetical protein
MARKASRSKKSKAKKAGRKTSARKKARAPAKRRKRAGRVVDPFPGGDPFELPRR